MVLAVPFEKPGFIFTKSRNQNEENVFGSTLSFFPRKYSSSSLNFSLLDSIYDRKTISDIFQKVLTAFVFVLMVALKSATQSQLAKNKQNKVWAKKGNDHDVWIVKSQREKDRKAQFITGLFLWRFLQVLATFVDVLRVALKSATQSQHEQNNTN